MSRFISPHDLDLIRKTVEEQRMFVRNTHDKKTSAFKYIISDYYQKKSKIRFIPLELIDIGNIIYDSQHHNQHQQDCLLIHAILLTNLLDYSYLYSIDRVAEVLLQTDLLRTRQ
jgi:hypothetical protein